MSLQYSIFDEGGQGSFHVAHELSHLLTAFVKPFVAQLHPSLDLRLVPTFLASLHVLLQLRQRNNGLLLARTGRLSRVSCSRSWGEQAFEQTAACIELAGTAD